MVLSSHLGEVSLLAQDRAGHGIVDIESRWCGLKRTCRLLRFSERLCHDPDKWALIVNRRLFSALSQTPTCR
jgi:hypothetical protein